MGYIKSPQQIMDELGIVSPKQIDLEAIAYYLNASVRYRSLDGCAARIIGYNGKAIISVDPHGCSEGRKRFSIGHEIGHWVNDRYKGIHLCADAQISEQDDGASSTSEKLANKFSSDLLLPQSMLTSLTRDRDMTLSTIKEIAEEFSASLTATAIKCISVTQTPSMIISFNKNGNRWFRRSKSLPEVWPVSELHPDSHAFRLLYGDIEKEYGPAPIKMDRWINHINAPYCQVVEHSKKITDDRVISILWWKDSRQLDGFR